MSDTPTDHDVDFEPFGSFLVESAPYRALAYRFWSAFFLGRDAPEWRDRSGDVLRVTAALLADDPEEDPLADVDAPTLARAFATLFYGVGEETVPLTTSAWTGAERLTAGRATDRARSVYRAHGLEVKEEDENLPEDHLGIALAFLADLAQKTTDEKDPAAQAKLLRHEREFLEEFVLSWWKGAVAQIRSRADARPVLPVFAAFTAYLRGVVSVFDEFGGNLGDRP